MVFSIFVLQGYPLNPSYERMLNFPPQSKNIHGCLLKAREGSGSHFVLSSLSVSLETVQSPVSGRLNSPGSCKVTKLVSRSKSFQLNLWRVEKILLEKKVIASN